jgi:uncharacterized protein YjbI with pentapeptide repeats
VDEQQQPSSWRTARQVLWIVGVVVAVTAVVFVINRFFVNRELWDWLKLLIVPAVLAAGGIWFNRQQRERELAIAREQRAQEVEIAERRSQDEALQAYLDQMSDMLIPNKDRPSLYKARPGDSLSSVARAQTLTVLTRLDGYHKARVVQFLYESDLIAKNRPIVAMRKADLSGAELSRANLFMANLFGSRVDLSRRGAVEDQTGANLSGADLREAALTFANLFAADLSGANLRGAFLGGADLRGAILRETNLSRANLSGADLREVEVGGTVLRGATMPDGQKYED